MIARLAWIPLAAVLGLGFAFLGLETVGVAFLLLIPIGVVVAKGWRDYTALLTEPDYGHVVTMSDAQRVRRLPLRGPKLQGSRRFH